MYLFPDPRAFARTIPLPGVPFIKLFAYYHILLLQVLAILPQRGSSSPLSLHPLLCSPIAHSEFFFRKHILVCISIFTFMILSLISASWPAYKHNKHKSLICCFFLHTRCLTPSQTHGRWFTNMCRISVEWIRQVDGGSSSCSCLSILIPISSISRIFRIAVAMIYWMAAVCQVLY